jgi:hypothetical protein
MKIIIVLCMAVMLTGCAVVNKEAHIAAEILGQNMGYHHEQALAMLQTQAINDPLMSANLQLLVELFVPTPGIFNSQFDKAVQEGYDKGVLLFQRR